jgi:hypothetical protein
MALHRAWQANPERLRGGLHRQVPRRMPEREEFAGLAKARAVIGSTISGSLKRRAQVSASSPTTRSLGMRDALDGFAPNPVVLARYRRDVQARRLLGTMARCSPSRSKPHAAMRPVPSRKRPRLGPLNPDPGCGKVRTEPRWNGVSVHRPKDLSSKTGLGSCRLAPTSTSSARRRVQDGQCSRMPTWVCS